MNTATKSLSHNVYEKRTAERPLSFKNNHESDNEALTKNNYNSVPSRNHLNIIFYLNYKYGII